jgi:RNA polymerase sigma-70 factor (ECF subfamily)
VPKLTPALLKLALSRDPRAMQDLAVEMLPIIQQRVSRILRCVRARRPELEDFVQDVYAALFDKDMAALRQWNPKDGLSLDNWVGLIAERTVISKLRKRIPWPDEPTGEGEVAAPADSERNPERLSANRQHIELVLERTEDRLTHQGRLMLQWLFVEERSVEDVCAISGKKHEQVYNWRSSIRSIILEVAKELRIEMEEKERKSPWRSP